MWTSLCVENTRVYVSYMHLFLVDSVINYSLLTLIILQVDSIKLVEHHVIEDCDLKGMFFSALAYKHIFSILCVYACGCPCSWKHNSFMGGKGVGGGEERANETKRVKVLDIGLSMQNRIKYVVELYTAFFSAKSHFY